MRFLKDEKGQGLSEYALIIALVAVVAIAGLVLLGPIILDKFNEVSCGMQGANWNPSGVENNGQYTFTKEGWYYVDTKKTGLNFNMNNLKWASGTAPTAASNAGCYKVIA